MSDQVDSGLLQEYKSVNNEIALIEDKISQSIASFQSDLKAKRDKESELKEKIKTAMQEKGVKKFENDYLAITYIAPTVRKTLDSKKLAADKPEVYEAYLKQSQVKDSVRIKVKETK